MHQKRRVQHQRTIRKKHAHHNLHSPLFPLTFTWGQTPNKKSKTVSEWLRNLQKEDDAILSSSNTLLFFQSNWNTSPHPNVVNRILMDTISTLFSTINVPLPAVRRTAFPSLLSPAAERKNRGRTWKKNTLTMSFNCQKRGQEHVHRLWSASMNHAAV